MGGLRRLRCQSQTPANVAVIKLDRLGDVVLCSQMLAELRRAWPKTIITLFVRESLVDLARLCPDVDEVIGVPVDEGTMMFDNQTGEYSHWRHQLAKWLRFCHRSKLWQKRFDAALVPRWETDYYGAIPLAYLMGAQQRYGVTETARATKMVVNRGFDQLLTHVISGKCVEHEFCSHELFLHALGIRTTDKRKLVSWAAESDLKMAAKIMAQAGINSSKKTILVCMGAGWSAKMWPVEHYAELCQTTFDPLMIQLATFGTTAEGRLGQQLKKMLGNGVVNLEGKIALRLLPACVSLCALYVGSDTGTMHLAVAAGLPVFEVSCHPLNGEAYWVESPLRFGPWAVPNRVVQPEHATPPCVNHCASAESHCIRGVSMEKATAALRSLLVEISMHDLCIDDHIFAP
jgi:heptosyltransferase III